MIKDKVTFDRASGLPNQQLSEPVEAVNHPRHYQGKKYEVIDIIEDFDLSFSLGNSIKYILRAGKKNELAVQDLNKAIWYLQREIERIKK
jgi:hypothetical protein